MGRSPIDWTPGIYNRLSKYYDRLFKLTFPIGEKGQARVLEGMESGSLLDVACGTGTLLAYAHSVGMQCFGNDTSPGMLGQARMKVPGAYLEQASFYNLPFGDGQFDYVIETNAVSGVDITFEAVLDEMLRVCKVGGEVRIGDYAKSPQVSFWTRFLERIGVLIGDYPHDFGAYLESLGYQPEVEILGWSGMYQYVRVVKVPSIS